MGSLRPGDQRPDSCKSGALTGILVTILLGVVILPQAVAATSDPSLCQSGQTPLFNCSISDKIVSICSDGAKATYYFGSHDHIELSSQALSIADHMMSGGGETQISFSRGRYGYIIYDKTTRTSFSESWQNGPSFSSGLVVQKDGKTVSIKQCSSDATISSNASHFIQPGPFIEH